MKESILYQELRKYTFKTILLTLALFILSTILVLLSMYITTDVNMKQDYKILIDITTSLLVGIMLYISYVNYKLRQNMFMLYNAYNMATEDNVKKKILLRLETLFIIYDLNKLREIVKQEYNELFQKGDPSWIHY